ncbi:LEA type 2 family protein [Natronosalvus caseinilyticus]|uniref:LEA type 2 family protein n=1 Tax=Natronosalvus caseinilyticus TaxID=2953747 RepID=UPI0028B02EFB|nr:LEA type 2 family protein [Natronosalvus caseinilyticus]
MVLQTLRSLFLGSAVRIVGTLVLAVAVTIGGAFGAGVLGVPALESMDNEFGDVDDERTEILTDLTIHNPNPIGLGSADVDAQYDVRMNGVEMANGSGEDITVEPGTSTESLRTEMRNERIPDWWVTHIENGEQTHVEIDATISSGLVGRSTEVTNEQTVETDLLSAFNSEETRPINANRALVEDPILYVNATRGQWAGVDQQHTELRLEFDVYNPKSYAIPMSQLGYEITMNDVTVGLGESDREYVLQPGEETTIVTTTRIENENLDDWWVTHIENEQVSDLRIEFDATFELASGTTITIPLESMTYEETMETDIWGNDEASDGSDDGSEPDSSADAENETDSSAGEDDEAESGDGGGDESDDGTEDGADDETGDGTDDETGETGNETDDQDGTDSDDGDDDGLLGI